MSSDEGRQVLFGFWNHKAALWYLGLLYRRPQQFRELIEGLRYREQVRAGVVLLLHGLPYVFLLGCLGHLLLAGVLGIPFTEGPPFPFRLLGLHLGNVLYGIAGGIGWGIAFGIAGGIVVGIVDGIVGEIVGGFVGGLVVGLVGGFVVGIGFGIVVGLVGGIVGGIVGGLVVGIATGIGFGIAGGIAVGIAGGIAVGIAVGIAGGIAVGIAWGITWGIGFGIAGGITFTVCLLRVYYVPVHGLFLWPRPRGSWYRYHPVAWDDMCSIPFSGLDRLLVAFAEHDPVQGEREIQRLIDTYHTQRHQALRAKAILIGRRAGGVRNLGDLAGIVGSLPEGDREFLKQTPLVRQQVEEIAHAWMRIEATTRPFLREPLLQGLVGMIESFHSRVAGYEQPLSREFRAAAEKWLALAQHELSTAKEILDKERHPAVFRAGDPVDREQEAFVARADVVGELEQQLALSTGCPGIILYGRRRVGKSTVLKNLPAFLASDVKLAVFSMQDPRASGSLEHFVQLVGSSLGLPATSGTSQDLPGLFGRLSECDRRLQDEGKRLILAIDEYEMLDELIGRQRFPVELLSTVRESIQSHRRITWAFVGSHEITELKHGQWTSYLISARTIEVPVFTENETRLLLTEPMRYSSQWAKDDPRRPRFSPEFWGEGGIERIHREAGGWPHLVQLVAETLVDLVNEDREAERVSEGLFARALGVAIVRGHNVFDWLLRRECTGAGEWEYLVGFGEREAQGPPRDGDVGRALKRRLLVVEEGGLWRLRVPLMGRWLRERA